MKYFFGFLAAIGLIILVFVLILKGFSGNATPKNTINLESYGSTAAVVRLTVDGPVVADQEHNSYQITVGRDQAIIESFKGYERQSIETKAYNNNQESFETFLLALDRAGFAKTATQPSSTDPRGVCATGTRYTYELLSDGNTIADSWSASCDKGTFRGSASAVRSLFAKQIPDFGKVTSPLNL